MVKMFFFVLNLLFIFFNHAESGNVHCDYNANHHFHAVGNKYQCKVAKSLIIDSPEKAQIETVSGTHMSGKSSDDEIYFHINSIPIQYFPRGMDKFFKNLIGIVIWFTQLKEIHLEDLKPYRNLKDINILESNIEIIEEGLFDFNPDLEVVIFAKSKIFHISPTVFDNLSKLTTLQLHENTCIDKHSYKDRTATLEIIKPTKSSCTSSDFLNLDTKVKNLEESSKNLNYQKFQTFSQNLKNYESELKSSKFANFSPLKQKFQKLNLKIEDFTATTPKPTTTTTITPLIITTTETEKCPDIQNQTQIVENFKNLSSAYDDFKVSVTDSLMALDNKLLAGFSKIDDKWTTFEEMFEMHEENLVAIKIHVYKKLEIIEKDFDLTRYNILQSVDFKMTKLQNRIAAKIEEIMDEKMTKILKALKDLN